MKHIAVALLLLLAVVGCTQKPSPVATETQEPMRAGERPALAVEYVTIPVMKVYQQPAATAPVVAEYSFGEAISVLAQNAEWKQVRVFDNAGWVRNVDLQSFEQKKAWADNPQPRFYAQPVKVEDPTAKGQIVFEARVNTNGEVYNVMTLQNTTRNPSLENANAEALKQAKFYPMVEAETRKPFVYQHTVTY